MAGLLPLLILLLIGLGGAIAGSFVNLAIYTLAFFHPRPISPWSHAPAGLQRSWLDCLPILGWLRLRRESSHWGRGFWIRPLLIELALAAGLPWLYQIELRGALIPDGPGVVVPESVMLAGFISHTLLILLMTAATFIDFDEKTIPDSITIPGTLLGLLLMTAMPQALPQVYVSPPPEPLHSMWLTTSQDAWPAWLHGWRGLALGVLCLTAWCYALVPKITTLRRGWYKGWLYLHASTFRTSAWWQMGLLALIGSLAIAAVWARGGDNWQGLLTSLGGLAFGGALIWLVRIVGYLGLRKEAMGFGDVTLMAMIGAYLGWQSTIMVFFLAPVVALVIALAQWLVTGRRDIAFGPYLCGGALVLILNWPWFWENYGGPIFQSLGWIVPAMVGCGLAVMLGLLMLIRLMEEALFAPRGSEPK